MLNNGKDKCSCSNVNCERNANCEECLKFHKGSNSLTKCQQEAKKKEEAEKTEGN